MAIEHILLDQDSLRSLALEYLGDSGRWREIADYNRLEYPYILKDRKELEGLYARGYITIVRVNYNEEGFLRKGLTFKTKRTVFVSNMIKVFEVAEDTIIPAGVSTYYVPLRASAPGTFGNVMEYTITEVGEETSRISGIQFLEVYNEKKFVGGRDLNVRVTGEAIYIPTDSSEVIPEDIGKMLKLIGGEDLVLDSEGELVFEIGGDLASASGEENIAYAIEARLNTEVGELFAHPEYGTDLYELIGKPNLSNRDKLAEVLILQSFSQDDRIEKITVNSITFETGAMKIDMDFKIRSLDRTINIKKTLTGGGVQIGI